MYLGDDFSAAANQLSSTMLGIANTVGAYNAYKANEEWAEKMTQQDREWQEKMRNENIAYSEQRTDELWNKYGSPLAQRNALLQAGINPLAMNEGNTALQPSNTFPSQPSASLASVPNGGFYPLDPQTSVVGAQIANINADTALKEQQAGKTSAETATIEGLRKGQIDYQDIQVKTANFAYEKLSPKQLEELDSRIDNLNATYSNLTAHTTQVAETLKTMDVERRIKLLEEEFLKQTQDSRISKAAAECANELITNDLKKGELRLQGQTYTMRQNENRKLEVDATNAEEYSQLERSLGIIGKIIHLLSSLTGK
ncbi:minor capsid protein [Capybara microvirus Cap3_SP_407]|nr:minor capsid protein [Capybara microvirus Cap3_SP_407]